MELTHLRGCGTALVTPFQQDGRLDEAAVRRLVRRQLEEGIDFLVPCGTTGESPVLTAEEHARVIEITLEEARGKVPVIAGAGGNNTRRVCEQVRQTERLGVDGILSVSPYYNKPTQEGLYQHFRAIAQSTSLPVIVYNVPGRTGCNIEPATLVRLAEIPNILGVKEASGNVVQIGEILRRLPERFRVISGDDSVTLPLLAMGACGVISVVSNVVPREMTEMVSLCHRGDLRAARRIHYRLLPLMQVLFIETSPIPVKAALAALDLVQPVYRLPLVPMQPETHAKLLKVLEDLELPAAKEKQYAAGGAD
ncbi:MAG: 4-hydroxy-tetrahydrodipicolinate synthase [Acidobacteria bacterium RIFCSPLOWO2_02_FULL_61_28]|nr:MAG: 4-hydroxy-tetrahydrodipicolinate synthase [Acidobacteria bacterium RIFCSPLOWO2_02_FULL_61_28]